MDRQSITKNIIYILEKFKLPMRRHEDTEICRVNLYGKILAFLLFCENKTLHLIILKFPELMKKFYLCNI